MNKNNLFNRVNFLLVIGLVLSACTVTFQEANSNEETQEVIGMANPAAQYCQGMGYRYESVERDGGMDADCVFPNGERCGQWDFLAGRCGQEMSHCELQGGTIQESGNVGICTFSDGSTCNELQLFNGDCSMGDNPQAADQETGEEEDELEDTETGEAENEAIQITDFISARDHLMVYLAEEYGIESPEPWMETNITSPDAAGVTTYRFLSGALTIVLSAEASAPYASLYTVQEAADLATGFWWAGTVSLDGTIVENEVVLPSSILNQEHARDAVLGYLTTNYGISSPTDWVDEGFSQTGNARISQTYRSGSWLVLVEFEPAAPMVSSYKVTVENSSNEISWEGEISSHGEIVQISFSQ